MRRRCGLTPAAVLLAVVGCGKSDGPVVVHPVQGQVLYDGHPAAGVKVFFVPTSAPMVPHIPANPHAVTGADGSFTLTTYIDGDGAAEGGYQIVLLWEPESKNEEEGSDTDKLLGWYGPVHSKLTTVVKPGPNVLPPFKLPPVTRAPSAVEGVPGKN